MSLTSTTEPGDTGRYRPGIAHARMIGGLPSERLAHIIYLTERALVAAGFRLLDEASVNADGTEVTIKYVIDEDVTAEMTLRDDT